MSYLTQWRMELAREDLADRRLSTPEVAEKVDYQSLPAFSRAFKRDFGFGPCEVRRRHSPEPNDFKKSRSPFTVTSFTMRKCPSRPERAR